MLVLDANILIRAVLGSRVLGLLRKYAGKVEFMAPDVAFQEAREHLPGILAVRTIPVAPAMETLYLLIGFVQSVESGDLHHPKLSPGSGSRSAMKTTGLSWLRPSRSAARSRPKTPSSSAAAWRPGRQIAWSCTWQKLQSGNNDGRRILSERA